MKGDWKMRNPALWFCIVLIFIGAVGANCEGMSGPPDELPPDMNPPADPPRVCEPACGFGLVCVDGACVGVDTPVAQIGQVNAASGDYLVTPDGATMPLYTFGQGGGHMFVSIRVAGISAPPDGTLDVSYEIVRPSDSVVLSAFQQMVHFDSLEGGILEAPGRVIFLNDFPELLHEDTIRCSFVVTSPVDPAQRATVNQTLILDFRP
jgi:hypothetical protein